MTYKMIYTLCLTEIEHIEHIDSLINLAFHILQNMINVFYNDFQSIVFFSNENKVITLIIMSNIEKIVVMDQVSLRGTG